MIPLDNLEPWRIAALIVGGGLAVWFVFVFAAFYVAERKRASARARIARRRYA